MPARIGTPPLTVGVLLDQAGEVVEMRAGNELPEGDPREVGWVLYQREPSFGRKRDEPHTFRLHPGL